MLAVVRSRTCSAACKEAALLTAALDSLYPPSDDFVVHFIPLDPLGPGKARFDLYSTAVSAGSTDSSTSLDDGEALCVRLRGRGTERRAQALCGLSSRSKTI
jgi:hypothetical protein